MRNNKTRLAGLVAAVAVLFGGLALTTTTAPVQASNGNSDICAGLDSGKIDTTGDPATVSVTAPEGKLISQYCVKAGTVAYYIGVNPAQESVTIDHPDKDSVSHYSVKYVDKPTPTTTTTTTTTVPPVEPPPYVPPTFPELPNEECTEYRYEKSTSTFNGETGTWSEWADWHNAGPRPWGWDGTKTGNHDGTPGEDGHRVYAYRVVDQRPITTGECAVPDPAKLRLTFIQECGTFTPLDGPWVAPETVQFRLRNSNDVPVDYVLRQAGSGIVQQGTLPVGDTFVDFPFGARTLILETYNEAGDKVAQDTKAGGDTFLTTDNDEQKCLPETPEPKVDRDLSPWEDGTFECGDTTVTQTRIVTITTTTYTWNGEGFDETVDVRVRERERTRDLSEEEQYPCPPEKPEPIEEVVETVDCEAFAVRITITTTDYVYDEQSNTWVLGEPVVTEKTRVLNDDEIEDCTPEPKVEVSEWVDGTFECGDTIVEQTRTVTTTAYGYVDGVLVGTSSQVIETQHRTLADDEIVPCVTVPETTIPVPTVPPTVPPSGDLPATGSNGTNSTLLIALAALLAGGLLLGAARRKVDA